MNPDALVRLTARRGNTSVSWELAADLAEVLAAELKDEGWSIELEPVEVGPASEPPTPPPSPEPAP